MPIINTPFERVALDFINPSSCSDRVHQYVLILMDYVSRFPEAIPIHTMQAKWVCKTLVKVFSQVDIPKEILTDCETSFIFSLVKQLC